MKHFRKYEGYFRVSTGLNPKVLLEVCDLMGKSGGLSAENGRLVAQLKTTISLPVRSAARKNQLVAALNSGQPFIMPMFKSNHAVYIAVEPLPNDTCCFAICNGGTGFKVFHGADPLDEEVDENGDVSHYHAHCIFTTSNDGLHKLIDVVELHQYTDNIIPEVKFLLFEAEKALYNRLDPIALFHGLGGGVFDGKEVCIKKQQVGNCVMHNLIQALRYTDKSYVAPITFTNNVLVRNKIDLERAGAVTSHLQALLLAHKDLLLSKYDIFCVEEALRLTKDYNAIVVQELDKLNLKKKTKKKSKAKKCSM